MRTLSLFEADRLTMEDSLAMTADSLNAYGSAYDHWAIAYSGGKDSTALVAAVTYLIESGRVAPPNSLTVLYADTRQELPPLQRAALRILSSLEERGYRTQVVLPQLDDRFYVYVLGRGVPPPSNTFRWCTPQLKIEPMHAALAGLREMAGHKVLMLTGVRLGESAVRDQRIAVSCSKDSGECGQGWFQVATPESLADTLAPLLHWRLCHVYDWLYFEPERHGLDTSGIAAVYGEDDVRTGCVGCNLASRDNALERLIRQAEWEHLRPLLEIKPLFAELKMAKHRKRKSEPELRQDGQWAQNAQRLGPLTMEARAYGMERIKDIQTRAGVDLVNAEEEARIRELWALNTWPNKWTGEEVNGDVALDAITVDAFGDIVSQPLLVSA